MRLLPRTAISKRGCYPLTAGHLAQQPADARQSESYNILGVQFETSHATGAVSPLRASGAMALLSAVQSA